MCVAVGTAPREVVGLDAGMFDALERTIARRWPLEVELAAVTAELESAQLVAFMAAHSKKGAKLPEPLRIPRPPSLGSAATGGDPSSSSSSSSPPRVSPREFAAMIGGGGS